MRSGEGVMLCRREVGVRLKWPLMVERSTIDSDSL